MARRKKDEREEDEAPRAGVFRSFFGFINTTVVLVIILYVAVRAMTYTSGFRNLVEEQLLTRFDLPVAIGKMSSNWRCDLALENVTMTNAGDQAASPLRADRVELAWCVKNGLPGLRRVEVTGGSVVFVARGGVWEPASMAPLAAMLAKWLDVDLPVSTNGVAAAATNANVQAKSGSRVPQANFSVRDLNLVWRTGATGEVARVSGVKLDVSSVHVPGRDFRHYRLKLDEAVARDGTTLKNVDLELIDAGDQQIVLGFKAERHKAGL